MYMNTSRVVLKSKIHLQYLTSSWSAGIFLADGFQAKSKLKRNRGVEVRVRDVTHHSQEVFPAFPREFHHVNREVA